MQNLAPLIAAYTRHPAVLDISSRLSEKDSAPLHLSGLSGAQESFVLAGVVERQKLLKQASCHLFIANTKDDAAYRHNDLEGLLNGEQVFFFPDSFKRPAFFDDLNPTQMLQRSELVSKITGSGHRSSCIVSYPEALFEKVVKPEILGESRIEVKKGEKLDVDFVIQVLVEYGFTRTDFVYEPGQFSIRGGIVDLFSFGNDLPYRMELFDDEVETIRIFDPTTQLSQRSLSSLTIVPNINTRFRQDQKVSLFRILPADTVIWVSDWNFLLDRLDVCFEQAEKFAARLTALDPAELREVFRDRAFLYPAEVTDDIADRRLIHLS